MINKSDKDNCGKESMPNKNSQACGAEESSLKTTSTNDVHDATNQEREVSVQLHDEEQISKHELQEQEQHKEEEYKLQECKKRKVAEEAKRRRQEQHEKRMSLFGARALAAGNKKFMSANSQVSHKSDSTVRHGYSLQEKSNDTTFHAIHNRSELLAHRSNEQLHDDDSNRISYSNNNSSSGNSNSSSSNDDNKSITSNKELSLQYSKDSNLLSEQHEEQHHRDLHSNASSHLLSSFNAHRDSTLEHYFPVRGETDLAGKYLVIGDNLISPFMALCLRVHGLECDLAQHETNSDVDRGTIVLTPSVTQLMGDVLSVSVPSGSVVGRILTFDHVGNDLCDLDLNEYREKGESPTFFCCDRIKVERALLSLCEVGVHSCHVLPKPLIDRNGLEPLDHGRVRVKFGSGMFADYKGVICTARNMNLWPELTLNNTELQQRAENAELYKKSLLQAARWLEICVPPLPELGKHEKRFTPGSQEIVEILTPREAKMTVRPTMMATKLFYNITLTIPDGVSDPRLRSTSVRQFWDDVISHWTSNIPGYVSHTMFRPMIQHIQEHLSRNNALVYRSPLYLLPNWTEGEGRVIKIGPAVHSSCFDAVDVSDAQSFTDCFTLARALANGENIHNFIKERQLEVLEEMDYHKQLIDFNLKERRQMQYMYSRFKMKFLRKYKKSWRAILKNYVTLMPKSIH